MNLLFTRQVYLSLGIRVRAIMKSHWSWVVHVSPHLAVALRAPLCLLVTRQGHLSLCVQEFAIIEFRG